MSVSYLLDEHVPRALQSEICRLESTLSVCRVGEVGSPTLGTLDPQILDWSEQHGFSLVTNNRRTMPRHLADHLAKGRHVPGIFLINAEMSIGETAEELLLIALASAEDEYRDLIVYLPVS